MPSRFTDAFKQQTITDSVANIWMWFINKRVPKLLLIKKKTKQKTHLIFFCFFVYGILWGIPYITAGISKFSLEIRVTVPLYWGQKENHKACSRTTIFCHLKWLLRLAALELQKSSSSAWWLAVTIPSPTMAALHIQQGPQGNFKCLLLITLLSPSEETVKQLLSLYSEYTGWTGRCH